MKIKVEDVTPETAKLYLQSNIGNRRIRKSRVTMFRDILLRGDYILTHQGIAFARDGRLIDGQHRLLAIIESGVTISIVVARDVDKEAYLATDQGARKSTADVFNLSKPLAEVARLAALITLGKTETQKLIQPYLGILATPVEHLLSASNTSCKLLSSAPVRLGACVRILEGENVEYVTQTYDDLVNVRLERLPPVAQSLVRQAIGAGANKLSTIDDRLLIVAKSLGVFDREKAQSERLPIKNPSLYLMRIRDLFNRLTGVKSV